MEIYHANALRLGTFGVMITGASGTGKSVLTLALVERGAVSGHGAALVGDDYIYLEAAGGRLIAHTAAPIAGAMEIRGAGLFAVEYEEKVVLDLVVALGETGERYPKAHRFGALGVEVKCLHLPSLGEADGLALCQAVEATLFKAPWHGNTA
ncbi:MAG: Hypothetical protein BHV28_01440 [Candidatus Tokpelaia hoelldobleri]|uniref:HPr kinase/phosphorylase C-terminal domain-containing protein n=1 Tax=Candidatus Tokpelaia hoelldobleri TaxID=1902579 RepID=A0A1U9JSN4_9HYPH|nr:MAG: Hypothetical protein BHV28_01440 [Candidatus Tokpelaia hoelldoblerii]